MCRRWPKALAQSLLESFERDLLVCDRITLDEWKRRSIGHKALEALASFVQDQV